MLGQDRRWRRAVAARVATATPQRLLDVCTGTGDLALGQAAVGSVYGCDFCLPMLALARDKTAASATRPAWFAADALRLPLADAALDAVTVAFGLRNFEDLEAGLHELARVLRPQGRVVILEFSTPRGALAPALRPEQDACWRRTRRFPAHARGRQIGGARCGSMRHGASRV